MRWILIIALAVAAGTVLTGIYFLRRDTLSSRARLRAYLRTNLVIYAPLLLLALGLLVPEVVYAATQEVPAADSSKALGLIAAALSTGMATIGAGYAVGAVGSSALGAVSEDPKLLGKTLIFVGLAEGIAIYGLIISILILGRL